MKLEIFLDSLQHLSPAVTIKMFRYLSNGAVRLCRMYIYFFCFWYWWTDWINSFSTHVIIIIIISCAETNNHTHSSLTYAYARWWWRPKDVIKSCRSKFSINKRTLSRWGRLPRICMCIPAIICVYIYIIHV